AEPGHAGFEIAEALELLRRARQPDAARELAQVAHQPLAVDRARDLVEHRLPAHSLRLEACGTAAGGGSTSSGMGLTKGLPSGRSRWSALARSMRRASRMRSRAVPAITLAACSMPLCAAGALPCATSCQEWPG